MNKRSIGDWSARRWWPQALLVMGLAAAAALWPMRGQSDTKPLEGTVNLETPHVHPIDLSADQKRLLVTNTAAHTVEVFDTSSPRSPTWLSSIPVGLDPVTVRVRGGTSEAWVVNHLSDSINIIDLNSSAVIRTLKTSNEPADVVFAGNRAFVSCGDANVVEVFDLADLSKAPTRVAIAGEEPRALAVSPDGRQVYVAIFESGNGSTVLNGRSGDGINVVSRTEGPYLGQNPPPNAGSGFNPPLASSANAIPVSLIVRKSDSGTWLDDNNKDWSLFVSGALATASGRVTGWDLADNDVAIIDTNTLGVSYQKRLMNINMALAVHPSGMVTVVGTDATNQIRFEPNVRGRFLRVKIAGFYPGGSPIFKDLNPHLDYQAASVSPALKAQSMGDPRGIAWTADGSLAFITGMGSNNVIIMDTNGARVGQIAVGEGPTGLVLNGVASVGYVVNKFSGTVSVIDTNTRQLVKTVGYFDPTPASIKAGRPFLYNTLIGSGTGHQACASCHVDGRTDRLAWDLGNPAGSAVNVKDADNNTGAATGRLVSVSPMKGPMLTQTLQDITRHGSLHWRGDKPDVASFAGAFVSLQGLDTAPTAADMTKLTTFLSSIHLPPNPYRTLDNARPSTVGLPAPDSRSVSSATMNALRGSNSRNNNCLQCHLRGGSRNDAANLELGQSFVAPSFALLYKRLGYWPKNAGGSLVGTGFFHDGSDSIDRAARTNTAETQNDMLAELLSLEGPDGPLVGGEKRQDLHAGVGRQVTLMGSLPLADSALLDELVRIAKASPHVSLIAKAMVGTSSRGAVMRADGLFQSDRLGEVLDLAGLKAIAAGGMPLSFTLVAKGTEYRLALDRDLDGIPDAEELDRGLNPADPTTPVARTTCAAEGASCAVGAKAVVRFGAGSQWRYAVQEGTVACSVVTFGDPGGTPGARQCEVVRPAASQALQSQRVASLKRPSVIVRAPTVAQLPWLAAPVHSTQLVGTRHL